MNYIIPIAEFGNYFLFSILVGHVVLQFVPEANKPQINIPKPFLLLSTLGILIFSIGPLIEPILYFKEGFGLSMAVSSVLFDFQVGKAWLFTGFMAAFLWLAIILRISKYVQALLLILMIGAVGYAGHVASLSFWAGFISHSLHFLMVTIWVGVLLHLAWFTKELPNWSRVLRWFTPMALACFIVTILSGFILMYYVVDIKSYAKAWVLPYGQMLLIKHISIIPVLIFAFINGILVRKSIALSNFNPRPWLRGESIFLFVIFYVTGVLGTLAPPHSDVDFTVNFEGPSKWVEWLLNKKILTTEQTHFLPSIQSGLLILLSIIFLLMILVSFKRIRPMLSVVFGICFIVVLYLGLMFSLII